MRQTAARIIRTSAIAMFAVACHGSSATPGAPPTPAPPGTPNVLSSTEQRAGWRLLFDGKTTAGWRGYRMGDTMPAGWTVVDGSMTKSRGTTDIVTVETFTNFELMLDWKMGPAGNSGIFYRATEAYEHVYWSAPEYQLADDAATPDSKNPLTSAGSVYGFYAPPKGITKPANEWNTTRIVVNGPHVEHWMNGVKLAEYELWSPTWLAMLHGDATHKPLKFDPFKLFGLAKTGFIAIQGDHPGALALRNIKIHELK